MPPTGASRPRRPTRLQRRNSAGTSATSVSLPRMPGTSRELFGPARQLPSSRAPAWSSTLWRPRPTSSARTLRRWRHGSSRSSSLYSPVGRRHRTVVRLSSSTRIVDPNAEHALPRDSDETGGRRDATTPRKRDARHGAADIDRGWRFGWPAGQDDDLARRRPGPNDPPASSLAAGRHRPVLHGAGHRWRRSGGSGKRRVPRRPLAGLPGVVERRPVPADVGRRDLDRGGGGRYQH